MASEVDAELLACLDAHELADLGSMDLYAAGVIAGAAKALMSPTRAGAAAVTAATNSGIAATTMASGGVEEKRRGSMSQTCFICEVRKVGLFSEWTDPGCNRTPRSVISLCCIKNLSLTSLVCATASL